MKYTLYNYTEGYEYVLPCGSIEESLDVLKRAEAIDKKNGDTINYIIINEAREIVHDNLSRHTIGTRLPESYSMRA